MLECRQTEARPGFSHYELPGAIARWPFGNRLFQTWWNMRLMLSAAQKGNSITEQRKRRARASCENRKDIGRVNLNFLHLATHRAANPLKRRSKENRCLPWTTLQPSEPKRR